MHAPQRRFGRPLRRGLLCLVVAVAAYVSPPVGATAAKPPVTKGNPFAGAREYVDPQSDAAVAARSRRSWDPVGAAALDKLAAGSPADWYGDWVAPSAMTSSVAARLAGERAANALPVLVAYAIPHRDCGSYSRGGEPTAAAYRSWVAQLAAGIGAQKAVVVLEPDALAQLDCLSPADQHERTALLAGAVRTLTAHAATTVYLDAGNPGWHPVDVMATRLKAAGVAGARGFTLNVGNFVTDADNLAYGDALSRLLGGKQFLVDTSRNGQGPGDTWCNPSGRGLGSPFTTSTGDSHVDALTWVKLPGQSDGTCNGGPPAGQFWIDYAIGLGQRAR